MTKIFPRRAALFVAAAALLAFPTSIAAAGNPFLDGYKVLMHPRCKNCHPAGNAPLQGDDSRPHAFRVQRGEEGNGVTSVKCSNCHQATNQPGEHTPPGAPDPKVEGVAR